MSIEKLLIANRGEIARRIIRSCASMGIDTVAVYSEPDAEAPFVREATEAVPLGGRRPGDSYLRGDLIIEAARRTGADAIHPGYGFLSENSGFARMCADAGITFVGPSAESIDLMASKTRARSMMEDAGVPVVPGWHPVGDDVLPSAEVLDRIGFPLMVKASFGGGGRGMRIVEDRLQLEAALEGAQREAAASFGDGAVFVERYIASGRHIEVQIFGDAFGDVVHLLERECSIQRRHQKIIEESPAPNLPSEVRDGLHEAAVAAGRTLGYRGAGTVEFILAPDGGFYFLEVNTRLQVEHPVTEMVLGMDLVRLQLLVAEGRPLPEEVRSPVARGHAIEARLYAEDPLNGYAPTPGRVHRFEVGVADGIRVDSGIEAGSEVTVDYDPMLAKVIAHAPTRDEASRRLRLALRSARIHGVGTNRELLVAILGHATFREARVDTGFLDDTPPPELLAAAPEGENHLRLQLLAAALAAQASRREGTPVLRAVPSGWRNNPSMLQREILVVRDVTHTVEYSLGRSPTFRVDGEPVETVVLSTSTDSVTLVHEGVRRSFAVELVDGMVFVDGSTGSLAAVVAPRFEVVEDDGPIGSLSAPMPGTVVKVLVATGDIVEEGDLILVMEAMKMEHSICAPADGVVSELMASVGDSVDVGALLAVVDAEEGDADDVG